MSELRESLDEAMRAVIPGEPPVDAAMRRGKAIRRRRWVTAVVSAVAVAIVAGVGYPAVTHWRAGQAPPPVTHSHHVIVTDVPPARGAAAGLIASGVIGKQSWQVLVGKPGKLGTAQDQQCLYLQGTAFGDGGRINITNTAQQCGPVLAPGTDPVTFVEGVSAGPNQAQVGAVTAGVRYVVVQLGDGQQLKLIPVRVYGTRLIAFAAPLATGVASATAYLDDGQYLTSISVNLPAGLPFFGKWLRPGQSVPPRATAVIASGTTDGQRWSVTAYVGPWGTCLSTAAGQSACTAIAPMTTTRVLGFGGDPQVVYGSAAPSVSYLIVQLTDGRSFRAGAVPVGGEKLFAFALGKGQTLDRWTAYDAAGKEVSLGVL